MNEKFEDLDEWITFLSLFYSLNVIAFFQCDVNYMSIFSGVLQKEVFWTLLIIFDSFKD